MRFTAFLTALFVGSTASAATVTNGDFETDFNGAGQFGSTFSGLGTGRSWDVWQDIAGWTTTAGPGIEIQTNRTLSAIDAHSGQHYIELNSHGGNGGSNSTMAQDIMLIAGQYALTFQYAPRTSNAARNSIDFGIAGAIGSVNGNDGAVGEWTEVALNFTVETDGAYSLFFAATGTGGGSVGGLIDTVEITPVPLPASALLLLAGLSGFALMRRQAA